MVDYNNLPVTMEQSDIERLVLDLLKPEVNTGMNNADIAEAIIELINRQAYNYKPFTKQVADLMESWVEAVWSNDDAKLDEALTAVLVNSRPKKGSVFLEKMKAFATPPVMTVINDTLADIARPKEPYDVTIDEDD